MTRAQASRAGLAAATALACIVALTAGPASAETAQDARAAAQRAAAEVDRLQPGVDAALRAYQSALHGLAEDVSAGISASQVADEAGRQRDAASLAAQQRVRALYMNGGQTGLLASVLDARSPSDLARRIGNVDRVVDADRRATELAADAHLVAVDLAAERAQVADLTTATVGTSEDKLRELDALLDEAQASLDALDARASRLEEAERAAAALAATRAAADSARWQAADSAMARGIPVTFLALYRAAAPTCPGLPWPVLAAIGQVESGHGTNPNDSYAGAQGPMQFLPSTFAAYAVDGDGDGSKDIRNPADAVFSAANYLCANGGGKSDRGLHSAIFRYNHAQWYVAMVLRIAAQIADRFHEPPVPPYSPSGG